MYKERVYTWRKYSQFLHLGSYDDRIRLLQSDSPVGFVVERAIVLVRISVLRAKLVATATIKTWNASKRRVSESWHQLDRKRSRNYSTWYSHEGPISQRENETRTHAHKKKKTKKHKRQLFRDLNDFLLLFILHEMQTVWHTHLILCNHRCSCTTECRTWKNSQTYPSVLVVRDRTGRNTVLSCVCLEFRQRTKATALLPQSASFVRFFLQKC